MGEILRKKRERKTIMVIDTFQSFVYYEVTLSELRTKKMKIRSSTKIIEYFANMLSVGYDVKWIATDSDGNVFGHTSVNKPVTLDQKCHWKSSGDLYHLGSGDLEGMNWKETLVRLEK